MSLKKINKSKIHLIDDAKPREIEIMDEIIRKHKGKKTDITSERYQRAIQVYSNISKTKFPRKEAQQTIKLLKQKGFIAKKAVISRTNVGLQKVINVVKPTFNDLYRAPFRPLVNGVKKVSKNLREAVNDAYDNRIIEGDDFKSNNLYVVYLHNDTRYQVCWNGKKKGGVSNVKIVAKGTVPPLLFDTFPTSETIVDEVINRLKGLSGEIYVIKHNGKYYGEKDENAKKRKRNDEETVRDKSYEELEYKHLEMVHGLKKINRSRYQSISALPLFMSNAPIDPSIGKNIEYTHNNLCGPDALKYYIDHKNIDYKNLTFEEICIRLCQLKNIFDEKKNVSYHIELLQKTGTTIDDFKNFIKQYGTTKDGTKQLISLYVFDPFGKKILDFTSKDAHDNVIIKVKNDHMYIVTDATVKKELAQSGYVKQPKIIDMEVDLSKATVIDGAKGMFEKVKSAKSEICIVLGDWKEIIKKYIKDSNCCIDVFATSNKQINSFKCAITDKIILIKLKSQYEEENKMINELKEYKKKVKDISEFKNIVLYDKLLTYHGLGAASIARELLNHFAGVIPLNYYHKKTIDYIRSFKRPNLYEGYPHGELNGKRFGVDTKKAYSYARTHILDDIPIFDIHDYIESYKGGDIKCGYYRVGNFYSFKNTKNKCIYHTDSWYTSGYIKKLLEEDIITKKMITEQYIAKAKISKNCLESLTKFIFTVFDEDEAKLISNCGTGLFGTTLKKSLLCIFESGEAIVNNYILDGKYHEQIDKNLYLIGEYLEERLEGDLVTIHHSILDASMWHLRELMIKHCTEDSIITGLHTDCFYGYGLKEPEDTSKLNMWDSMGMAKKQEYEEITAQIFKPYYAEKRIKYDKLIEINDAVPNINVTAAQKRINDKTPDKNGVFHFTSTSDDIDSFAKDSLKRNTIFQGIAGCGKTLLLTEEIKIIKAMGKRYLCMAPTNKAVMNLIKRGIEDAKTLYSALVKTENGIPVSRYTNDFPFEYVLIDEAFNANSYVLRKLYEISKRFKVIIHMFGSPTQIPAVEKEQEDQTFGNSKGIRYDYMKSPAFTDMGGKRIIYLQYMEGSSRYDKKLYEECDKILKGYDKKLYIECDKVLKASTSNFIESKKGMKLEKGTKIEGMSPARGRPSASGIIVKGCNKEVSMICNKILADVINNYIQCERAIDEKLSEECDKILKDIVPKFAKFEKGTKIERVIAKRNKTVDSINSQYMINGKTIFKIPFKKYGSDCKLTEMKLSKGMLISPYRHGTMSDEDEKKSRFHNNQDFTFKEADDEIVTVYDDDKNEWFIDRKVFETSFIPAFAITADRIQGSTIDGKYYVTDLDIMCQNDLYVAVSRGRKWENVLLNGEIIKINPFKYSEGVTLLELFNKYKTGYIYKMYQEDKPNNIYIGSTGRTIKERFAEHMAGEGHDKFHEYIKDNLKGWKIEKIEKIMFLNIAELVEKERQYITLLNPYYNTMMKPKNDVEVTSVKQIHKKKEPKQIKYSYDKNIRRLVIRYFDRETNKRVRKQFNYNNRSEKEAKEEADKFIEKLNNTVTHTKINDLKEYENIEVQKDMNVSQMKSIEQVKEKDDTSLEYLSGMFDNDLDYVCILKNIKCSEKYAKNENKKKREKKLRYYNNQKKKIITIGYFDVKGEYTQKTFNYNNISEEDALKNADNFLINLTIAIKLKNIEK
jgi:hypothetical protein